MTALTIAILLTLLHAALLRRCGTARSMGIPVIFLTTVAGCIAASRFIAAPSQTPLTIAEAIVWPIVFAAAIAASRTLTPTPQPTTTIRGWTALAALLGIAAIIDRIDAFNAQLLLVLGLAVAWIQTNQPAHSDRPNPSAQWAARAAAAGLLAALATGWAALTDAPAWAILLLIAINLSAWAIARRHFAAIGTAFFIATCTAIGISSLIRVLAGARTQPDWSGGANNQWTNSIALELLSRPYLPGFSQTTPEVVALVLILLFTIFATQPTATPQRRRLTSAAIMTIAGALLAWMIIASA